MNYYIGLLIAKADTLIVAAHGMGARKTCINESRNGGLGRGRAKGQNIGPTLYALCSDIALLRGNSVSYVEMKCRQAGTRAVSDDMLWQLQLYNNLGIPVSAAMRTEVRDDFARRRKVSASLKTVAGKIRKIPAKQKTAWNNAQRKNYDGGRTYGVSVSLDSGTISKESAIVSSGTLVFTDIETAGFGPYQDTVLELCCHAVSYTAKPDGGYEFGCDGPKFRRVGHVEYVNSKVPGHAHITEAERRSDDAEGDIIRDWLKFLTSVRNGASPLYIVAHNGLVFDGPFLHRAMKRANIDPERALEEIGVQGLIDTLPMIRRKSFWEQFDTSATDEVVTYKTDESWYKDEINSIKIRKSGGPFACLVR
jgi:uncharacterized protein YprB with RNaseH-like and TPR domain